MNLVLGIGYWVLALRAVLGIGYWVLALRAVLGISAVRGVRSWALALIAAFGVRCLAVMTGAADSRVGSSPPARMPVNSNKLTCLFVCMMVLPERFETVNAMYNFAAGDTIT